MMTPQKLLDTAESGLQFASKLAPKICYSVKHDGVPLAGSIPTVYRRLAVLANLGLANVYRGQFQINRAARQPVHILKKLVPSLISLKNARRFGRKYNTSDVNFIKKILPKESFITLDYKAWEVTHYQYPMDLYVYVDDIEHTSKFLKDNSFSEGVRGHIVLLQKQSETSNNLEQVYFDCIAKGGRGILDAIALELQHGKNFSVKGRFNLDDILKVQDDMQRIEIEETSR